MSGTIMLLGPQRPSPNLAEVLLTIPGDGRVVTVTAGWRHEEAETEALHRVAGPAAASLPIYQWFEDVMAAVPEIAEEWRQRQAKIVELKNLHRIRMHPALEALQKLLDRAVAGSEIARVQIQWQLDQLRDIDQEFLDHSGLLCRQHPTVLKPWEHPAVASYHQRAAELLAGARAVLIAGGHVAVLRNRLEFFGVEGLLRDNLHRGTSVVAWSAGAMALTERILLFYDDPPDGPGHPELLDRGFELVRGLVLFPHCRRRLRLDETRRVSLLATRLAPATCVGLESGAWLAQVGARWVSRGDPGSALRLKPDGAVTSLTGVMGAEESA